MFIGQEKLKKFLEKVSLDSLPRSLILTGSKGCGKHLFSQMIYEKLKKGFNDIDLIDITDKLTADYIEAMYSKSLPTIYIVSADNLSKKDQNSILKFLEEPLKNSYIIILCEQLNQLLDTVQNRCIILSFQPYSKEQLKAVNDKVSDELLQLCETPGDVLQLSAVDLAPYQNLAASMIHKIHIAAISNALTIADKINFKNDTNKLDLEIFNKILKYSILETIKNKCYDLHCSPFVFYDIVDKYIIKTKTAKVNQQYLFEALIVDLWEATHD